MENKMEHKNNVTSTNSPESAEKLHKRIKETWSGLGDSDIKLYSTKPDEFFAKLQEKHHVSKEDAQKKLQQIEKDCGCGSAKAA